MDPLQFLSLIMSLRCRFPFSVTSWLRTPSRNEMFGGAEHSLHLSGLAVDVVLDSGESEEDFKAACQRIELVHIAFESGIHIQASPMPMV